MPGVILIVEDDEATCRVLRRLLEAKDYQVIVAPSLFHARGALVKSAPELVVLDRGLPDGDGLDFCRDMKAKGEWRNVPILFLSLKETARDKVAGLEVGGDDYLAKPFDEKEFMARITALFRRRDAQGVAPVILQAGDLRLDESRADAFLKDRPLKLWPKEFEMLRLLVTKKGQVLSRETLLRGVWGYEKELTITAKTVDVTVSRLRKKLGRWGDRIASVKGLGYRFDDA